MLKFPAICLISSTVAVPLLLWIIQFTYPAEYARLARWVRRTLEAAARRRWRVVIGSAVSVLAIRACLLPVWPIPEPSVLDEFSYLLLGDTFAAGRLANPPHPLWHHFETLFVLQQPTYASVYPVVQGLFLAAGQKITGRPWWGVWLSVGLMCAAVSWALQGWLPPPWAFVGAIWIAVQWGLSSYWIDSYWGGAASATGGALLAGAAACLRRRILVRHSLVFAFGLALLANTRPYEGFLLGAVMTVWLITRIIRSRLPFQVTLFRVIAPVCSVLAVTAAGMAIYFSHVTGNPIKTPYQAYIEQYAASPAFVWQKRPPEPVYRHVVLRDAHLSFLNQYKRFDTLASAVQFSLQKLSLLGTFYVGPLLFVPIVALPWVARGRARLAVIAVVVTLGGILLTVSVQPHYGAPLTVLFLILTLQAFRYLRAARRFGNPIGDYLTPAAAVICAAYIAFLVASPHQHVILSARPKVIHWLQQNGRSHLVIVRYGKEHSLAEEWVYNSADVDRSDIVWARDMGPTANAELLRYYPNRKTWLLLPESPVAQLIPYDRTELK